MHGVPAVAVVVVETSKVLARRSPQKIAPDDVRFSSDFITVIVYSLFSLVCVCARVLIIVLV